jgi:hypothetical protein
MKSLADQVGGGTFTFIYIYIYIYIQFYKYLNPLESVWII